VRGAGSKQHLDDAPRAAADFRDALALQCIQLQHGPKDIGQQGWLTHVATYSLNQ
jgi:hypothetical protein